MAPILSAMTRLSAVISSVILLSADTVLGTTTREKTLTGTYDYIIVGGGVSGLVVANRLSEKSQSTGSTYQREALLTMTRICSCPRVWLQ